MSDRNSHHSGTCPNDNINLFGNRPRLFDGSIRRSASMGNLTGSNDSGLYDEKSDHEDGYISEDIESGRQRRKGVLRTEEGHSWFLPGLHNSAQEPSSTREDDVTTEEELNTRVEALIKNFYSQMQKRKSVEALSPKEDDMMTEEELNDRVGAFIEKFHSQMQKRKPVDEPWWKVLDFAALKQSPVSFFNTEEPETAVTRWEKARRRAAKIESDDEAHHKRDGSSTRKVALDHIFVVGNFVLELPSAVFDQLSSLHKPQYALLSMLTSITAILICVIELVHKGREGRVTCMWTRKIPWLYYPGQGNKPFATLTDIIGLVCAIFQGIFTSITYAFYCRHTDSPVKISAWPLVFAFGLLCSKFFNKSEKKAIPHKSQD
ncbi:hypothetical protein QYF36_023983 [Acer negundo]|nr:hypothetical protein QYF36_023983 [Acer negundo]